MPAKKKTQSIPAETVATVEAAPKKSLSSIGSFAKKRDDSRVTEKPVLKAEPRKKDSTILILWIVISMLLLSSAGAALYFYRAYREASEARQNGSEAEQLVARISRFMELPQGESPTLATVTDKVKLEGQVFFKNAENGDKVLIYESSGKAIIFRPSTGRIMNVSAVNVGNSSIEQKPALTAQQPEAPVASTPNPSDSAPVTPPTQDQPSTPAVAAPAPEGKAKVTLFNGSKTIGVTAKIEKTVLSGLSDSIEVIGKDTAAKSDYEGVTVYDVSGVRSKEAASLAALLSGTVVTEAPAGETVPDGTDILIIVGAAKK